MSTVEWSAEVTLVEFKDIQLPESMKMGDGPVRGEAERGFRRDRHQRRGRAGTAVRAIVIAVTADAGADLRPAPTGGISVTEGSV